MTRSEFFALTLGCIAAPFVRKRRELPFMWSARTGELTELGRRWNSRTNPKARDSVGDLNPEAPMVFLLKGMRT